MAALADELTVTAEDAFTRRVDTVSALAKSSGAPPRGPDADALRLAYETLELPADDDPRLIVHLPADAATSAALDHLNSAVEHRSQPLRLVVG